MECREPGAIREEELIAHLEGEPVRPLVVQHLAQCQHCSSLMAVYQRIERTLVSKLYRWDCPSNQVLGDYYLEMLDRKSTMEIENHLQTCVLCSAEVATLSAFLTNDPLITEPAPILAADHQRPTPVDLLHNLAQTGLQHIIATLLPAQSRLAYQRDASQQTVQWPRRYTAENVSISIQVERNPKHRETLQIIGFVTRKDVELEALQGTPVRLIMQDVAVDTQTIDELGNFVFSPLDPAMYTVELQFPDGVIVIDQLQLSLQD